jgi:hypothetical protein
MYSIQGRVSGNVEYQTPNIEYRMSKGKAEFGRGVAPSHGEVSSEELRVMNEMRRGKRTWIR